MERGAMSWEVFEHLSRQLAEHLSDIKVVVLYHGGEPLIHRQFVDMVRHFKRLGVPFIKTVSNGMLLTEKIIENVVSSGLDLIEISLDGQSIAENNLVRRPSNGDTVIRNVKRLLEHRKAHPESTLRVAISSTQFVSQLDGGRPPTPAPVPRYVVEALGDLVSEVSEFKTTWAMVWPHMTIDEQVYDVVTPNEPHEALNECDLVDVTVSVRWNGDVVSCCYDLTSRYVLGNILQESLDDIWNGKKYLGLRRSIDTRRFVPLCANCSKVQTPRFLALRGRHA
jgi:radical SAM protein with 4Fe4S-binding SPASM domain